MLSGALDYLAPWRLRILPVSISKLSHELPQALSLDRETHGGGRECERASLLRDWLIVNREAWRYSGPFTRWNRFKGAFPGFGIGLGAFLVYSAYEAAFAKDTHGHGHGESTSH